MARRARLVLPGYPHYILQSGWEDNPVFIDKDDGGDYQTILMRSCASAGLQILAYCFMPSEIHLLAIPLKKESLRKGIGDANRLYTREMRKKGKFEEESLWAERFHSCPVDNIAAQEVLQVIEWLPVLQQFVKYPHQWHYSSARPRALEHNDPLVTPHPLLEDMDWMKIQSRRPDYRQLERVISHQSTGRPLGDRQFIEKLERQLGRRLRPRKRGRRPAAEDISSKLNSLSGALSGKAS